jgi:hypothetical protein
VKIYFRGICSPLKLLEIRSYPRVKDSMEVIDLPMKNPDNIEHDLQVTPFLQFFSRDISWLSNVLFLLFG